MHCKLCNTEQPDRLRKLKPTEFTQSIFDYLGESCCKRCNKAIHITKCNKKKLNKVFNIDHYILAKLYRNYRLLGSAALVRKKKVIKNILPGIFYRVTQSNKIRYLVYTLEKGKQRAIGVNTLQEAVDIKLAAYSIPFYKQKFLQAVEKYIKQQGKAHE